MFDCINKVIRVCFGIKVEKDDYSVYECPPPMSMEWLNLYIQDKEIEVAREKRIDEAFKNRERKIRENLENTFFKIQENYNIRRSIQSDRPENQVKVIKGKEIIICELRPRQPEEEENQDIERITNNRERKVKKIVVNIEKEKLMDEMWMEFNFYRILRNKKPVTVEEFAKIASNDETITRALEYVRDNTISVSYEQMELTSTEGGGGGV